MNDDERRIRAYRIWESEGCPAGQDLPHWYRASDVAADPAPTVPEYSYYAGRAPAGSLIVKFYHSGHEIRGYVRQVADENQNDTIFPGEEMEPEAAFNLAWSHNGNRDNPVFVELAEGVEWDPAWGRLAYQPD
ncbi:MULTISPECIES: DUF2934 domain-containing protein [unclassified Rhizobium]|uniref:DUF2934 domain-containing protein n=1 Tax=unclassified Rhizobium TaxID=2613769 RepID=UPI000BE78F46|nr:MULTISPECIES: DUF2934 domain-containing protein [unclassified Rhizobium]MDF0663557.1 DUF2934 domain-containing protein [Rhizobium sp. BC49]PDS78952.1 hypothetical protein CO654_32545 [Rhizobium sp. L18]